jgi:hypothetical protein
VIYPPNDSGGTQAAADRDVWFAYNAQGQEVWRQDQTELEIQLDYDTGGRLSHRRVIEMDTAGDLDTTVRRISYTYTPRGQIETVTQWDEHDPASGTDTELDQVKYTHDDWGNITSLEQDHNGVVGDFASLDDYEVRYTYTAHAPTNARSMVRNSGIEILYGSTGKYGVTYGYGTTDSVNDLVGRVRSLDIASTAIVLYEYDGEAELVSTHLTVPNLLDSMFEGTTPPDRFRRVVHNEWHRYHASVGSTGQHYSLEIAYDRASNITRTIDNVQIDPQWGGAAAGMHAFDAAYSIDGLNRVTRAQEGEWDTSSITSEYRDELWTLTQTGNWSLNQVDLDGDNSYTGPGELNDTRSHNAVNEILTRNTDSAGGVEFTLAYNLRGDLVDEGGDGGYKYVWDAFGRLVAVYSQGDDLVSEYRYNGLNQRITWHYDADEDADVDGSDPTYHFCYDTKWRIVGTWRGTDTDAKELFTYHNAGVAGRGGSSYIDSVVFRDRDMNGGGGWTGASDGTLEARHYYAQNWRADVSAVFDNAGTVLEWIKYSSYGVPFLLTPGDYNKDGIVDGDDEIFFDDLNYENPRADLNRDGQVDVDDEDIFIASYNAAAPGGRWKLSSADVCNRKGYAGYEHEGFGNDLAAPEIAHVRNRVLHFGLGRWTRRDPLGYVDGTSLNEYGRSSPAIYRDATGLACSSGRSGGCGSSGNRPPGYETCPHGYRYNPYLDQCERVPEPHIPDLESNCQFTLEQDLKQMREEIRWFMKHCTEGPSYEPDEGRVLGCVVVATQMEFRMLADIYRKHAECMARLRPVAIPPGSDPNDPCATLPPMEYTLPAYPGHKIALGADCGCWTQRDRNTARCSQVPAGCDRPIAFGLNCRTAVWQQSHQCLCACNPGLYGFLCTHQAGQ